MQERSSKAANQMYKEGAVCPVGTCAILSARCKCFFHRVIGKSTLKDDDSIQDQVVNYYILSGQMVYVAGAGQNMTVYLSILPASFPLSVNLKETAVVVLTDYLLYCLSG